MKIALFLVALPFCAASECASALEPNDHLSDWSQAAPEERVALVNSLIAELPTLPGREPTLADKRFLVNCLSDVASNGGANATIRDTARSCWRLVVDR